jgi:hypothetical protein
VKYNYKVGYSLCTYKCVEERRNGETHIRSPHRAGAGRGVSWHDEVRRWVWAYDVHMNSPSKSGPKTRRSAASFCRLVLL